MAWLERIGIGLLLAMVVIGSSAIALTSPGLTRALVVWSGGSAVPGLVAQSAIDTAEEVRLYVTGAAQSLPASVDGRPGFDPEAVAHLDDVARVLSLARTLAALGAAAVAVWLSWSLAQRRSGSIRSAFTAGAILTISIVVVATLLALADFDRVFAGFHAVLFKAGTWRFAEGALLIQLFPERFWVAMAGLWGLLIALGAGLLWVVGRSVGGRLEGGEFQVGE